MKVVMYTKTVCPYCIKAKAFLKGLGVNEIEEINLDKEDRKQEMIEKTGRMTVPQIFINGVHTGGCDDTIALGAEKIKEMLSK